MPPLFSIVTVVYNNAEGIRRTAESIRGQSLQDYEWVVIDGGSSDETLSVVGSFSDLNPRVLSERDRGIYDAMNKGLGISRGRFVNFMNSGDVFAANDVLLRVEEALRMSKAEPALIFGSSVMQFPNGHRKLRTLKNVTGYIWHGLPTLHQSIFFARSAHLEFPYPLGISVSADYAVVADMLSRGVSFLTIDAPVSINEIGGASFSHKARQKQHLDVALVQRKLGVPAILRFVSRCRRVAARLAVEFLSQAPRISN